MDRSDASALADLQMHWDEAYVIGLDGNIWTATYRTSADELRAHTCTELRELIRSDYAYRQRANRPIDDFDDDQDQDDYEEYGFYESDAAAERDQATVIDADPAFEDPALDDPANGGPTDSEPGPTDPGTTDPGTADPGTSNPVGSDSRDDPERTDFATVREERMSL